MASFKILLYPNYVGLDSARGLARVLFNFFDKLKVELQPVQWDGTLEQIPLETEPCIVRLSSRLEAPSSWEAVAKLANERGHLCIYNDVTVDPDGSQRTNIEEQVIAFLEHTAAITQ